MPLFGDHDAKNTSATCCVLFQSHGKPATGMLTHKEKAAFAFTSGYK